MSARDVPALLVGVVGAGATLAAVPPSSYRLWVLAAGMLLLVLAVVIAVVRRRSSKPGSAPESTPDLGPEFRIETPQANQVLNGGGIVVGGTVPNLDSDTLWVFEEGLINGRRAWFFGGEALVSGHTWSFDYRPTVKPEDGDRRTLSIVRADRHCDRQLRSVQPNHEGHFIVYDPAPGGCTVLGQVSMFMAARP
jgi:hypothetical protein